MPRCGCWLEMGDRSMVWISTIKSPNLAPGSFWLLSDTKNSAPSPSHKSKSKALPWTSEIGQVWVLLSLMGDLPLPIKKWPVMLKKIPLPLFKALVPSTGEWTRKVLPFLATTEVWEAKTNTNEGLFWSLWPNICSHMVFPRLWKAEIQLHFWLEVSVKNSALPIHSWFIVGHSTHCSLTWPLSANWSILSPWGKNKMEQEKSQYGYV